MSRPGWRYRIGSIGTHLALGALFAAGAFAQVAETARATGEIRQGVYRGRLVVYEVIDGWAIIEGDIILGTAQQMAAAPHPGELKPKDEALSKSLVRTDDSFLWPDGTIPYLIDAGVTNPQRIADAIDHWHDKTRIEFVQRTDQEDFVRFTAVQSGCSSFIGMAGGPQFVRLSPFCSTSDTIHEIGHTVGLFHEQSRDDRDEYVDVLVDNIDKRSLFNFTQPGMFGGSKDSGDYDFGSIMHYNAFSFSTEFAAPTIETIPPGLPIGQSDELSAGDIDGVNRLYGNTPTQFTVATNPAGLKVIVDGQERTAPARFVWTNDSMHNISVETQSDGDVRYLFGAWSDGGAKQHEIEVSPDRTVYTANFIVQNRISTGILPSGSGTVKITPSSPDGFYTLRTPIAISASPNPGNFFVQWLGSVFSQIHGQSANPATFSNTDPNVDYIAAFSETAPLEFHVNAPGSPLLLNGLLYRAPVNIVATPGSTLSVEAPPGSVFGRSTAYRWIFREWSDGGSRLHNVVVPAGGGSLTATFDRQYLLSAQLASFFTGTGPAPGEIFLTPFASDGYYNVGRAVTIAGTSSDDFAFTLWDGDLTGMVSPQTVIMDEQRVVTGVFTATNELLPGKARSLRLPAVQEPTLFVGEFTFYVEVPEGATALSVDLVGPGGGQDVDLLIGRGFPPFIGSEGIVTSHFSVSFGGRENIAITPTSTIPLTPGYYFISIIRWTPGALIPSTLEATIDGLDPLPQIELSAPALTFTAPVGMDPEPQIIALTNGGEGIAPFLANTDAPWLHVTPPQGMATEDGVDLTVSIDTTGAPTGTFNANVSILQVPTLDGGAAKSAPINVPVTLVVVGSTPQINAGGVVNVDGGATVAPGGVANIYGTNLAGAIFGAGSVPLPTELGGVRVTVNGIDAPLYFVSPLQINFQVPFEVPADGVLNVVVIRNGDASPPEQVQVTLYAPGLFLIPQTPPAPPLPIVQRFPDYSLITAANPAAAGDILIVYVNGIGGVTNAPATGAAPLGDPLSFSLENATATIGGAAAVVSFTGLAPGLVGAGQVNLQLPNPLPAPTQGPAGPTLTLIITIDGATSQPIQLPVTTVQP